MSRRGDFVAPVIVKTGGQDVVEFQGGHVSDGFVTVAKVGEIPEGGVKIVRLDDQPVAVFHLADGYYAIDDICTHDGGPLAEGPIEGDVIECPRHGARFDIKTGEVLCLPATAPVPTYAVRIDGDEIKVGWA